MSQNVGTVEQIQTTSEETVGEVAKNRRQKTVNSGQVGKHVDKKKNRGRSGSKTPTRVAITEHLVDESTELHLNSSMAGGMNRRRDEQNHKRQKHDDSSTTTAAASGASKYTPYNRMTMLDAANALTRPRRTKRGVLDNEVDEPDDDIGQLDRSPAPASVYIDPTLTSPNLLRGRKSHQKVASVAGSIYTSDEDTEQLPDSVFDIGNRKKENARGKRRNSRVRGRRRKQSSLMTLLRNPDDHFNDKQRSMAGDGTCKKKRLRVNFADIGWGEWIIAPDFFDAFYCDGFCSFPISRVRRLYNYKLRFIS